MKVAIVGSRNFADRCAVELFVSRLSPDDEVVSGGARGVDTWAVEYAKSLGLRTVIFPANWNANGLSAGFIRNKLIINAADRVVAFWDGKSKGTAHSIELAKRANKPLTVHIA